MVVVDADDTKNNVINNKNNDKNNNARQGIVTRMGRDSAEARGDSLEPGPAEAGCARQTEFKKHRKCKRSVYKGRIRDSIPD
jgi:hypothetical protein